MSGTWCKGDEPVRVGSKVVVNLDICGLLSEGLQGWGIVIAHDGSSQGSYPWVVLLPKKDQPDGGCGGFEHYFFNEVDLKVIGDFGGIRYCMEAVESIAPVPSVGLSAGLSAWLGVLPDQFGSLHEELEDE